MRRFLRLSAMAVGAMTFSAVVAATDGDEAGGQARKQSAPTLEEQRVDPVGSGSSTADAWRRRRLARATQLEPNRLSGFEKGMLWMEESGFRLLRNFNVKGAYPQFSNLSTGSGFAPGVRLWKPNLGNSPLDLQLSGAHSLKGYRLYDLQFGRLQQRGQSFALEPFGAGASSQFDESQPKKPGFFVYGNVRYRYFPQEDFFGLGPESRKQDRTDYLIEDMSYDAVCGWQLTRHLGAAARAGLLQVNIEPGTDRRFPDTQTVFSDRGAPGLAKQPDFLHVDGAIMLDYRDRPGNPHKGGMAGVFVSRFDDRRSNAFEFTRIAFETRQFLPLGSEQRVLALRLFASTDEVDAGSRVPFYFQETLGGSETLRGFREFRFRDRRTFYGSTEYRWEAAAFMELALFYDVGQVYGSGVKLAWDRLETSYGGGLRFKTPRAVILRMDVGHSREGTRFYFKFGPSF